MTQGRMQTMTDKRDGFSLAHGAALMAATARRASKAAAVAVLSAAAVVGVTSASYAGFAETVVVSNQGGVLAGTIATFAPNTKKNFNPSAVIAGASINFAGTPVPAENVLGAVNVNPTNGPGVFNATYALSNLSNLGGPDVLAAWEPGATGSSTAIVGLITLTLNDVPIIPLAKPQDLDFALTATGTGPNSVAVGDFFVTNLVGGGEKVPTGSVIHFPANAGTGANPFGLIANPFGVDPPEIPALVLQDSELSATNPFGCSKGASTRLLLPTGVRLDKDNQIWVVNSGAGGVSYITQYPPGAFGCVAPTTVIGLGTLKRGAFMALEPATGNMWVTDLAQNAIFEFSPSGAVLTTIKGNKAGKTTGNKPKLFSPMGIALAGDPANPDILVASNLYGAVLEFQNVESAGLLTKIKPAARIQGKKTKIPQPVGVAVVP
jgi:hypothetical protein